MTRYFTRHRLAVLAPLVAALALACSSPAAPPDTGDQALFDLEPDVRATVTMRDIRFDPAEIEAAPGSLIAIEFVNDGDVEHDFSVEALAGAFAYRRERTEQGHHSSRALHMPLRPGERGEVRLRLNEAGTLEFFCDVPGHRRGGMTGSITVR